MFSSPIKSPPSTASAAPSPMRTVIGSPISTPVHHNHMSGHGTANAALAGLHPSSIPSTPESSRGLVKIGQYVLGATLGVGSFGKVKRARHEFTGHEVAVKILNRNKIKSLDMVSKIRREIQYLKLFRHPHIIKLYEVISTPTDIFMVMEYVSGGELFEYIVKHGKLSEKDARRFFQQIISGVHYCHKHMVVHRDLKPENLLLDSNLNVKIADFGLSNMMTDGDFLKTSCGSPNYAAPEVISGKLYAGPEVDIWSCGVILYALLCGKLPFDDEFIPNLFKKIKGGIFSLPSHLSDQTKDLLSRMLHVDPLKRATLEEIISNPWFVQNLPAYLFPAADAINTDIFEEDIVEEVCQKFNVSHQDVIAALRGLDPFDSLKVAYQLIKDNKSIYQHASHSVTSGDDPDLRSLSDFALATSPPPFNESDMVVEGAGSVNEKDQMSALREAPAVTHARPRTASMTGKSSKKKRSRWHLGIRSRSSSMDVMSEVFRALKSLGFEWKVVTPYLLRCRCYNSSTGTMMKMNLQLYQVDAQQFLLDFKNLSESEDTGAACSLEFFECCSLLIRELAITA
ncbi:CAMK/CAMKL/AMPK protein kinase [Capsaspora owczarzaki ATCC 30864]|uniref:non-specific serine/threonine protein kinase n=1 Tax=Capsaspora owczarzaki (strain ATCC 30864) TaxID=595528 RepID=A0A0D2WU93_CAPO3|nr:CAMK/CAMKL/AMPK protein kinase [Capsaspora owczarzaki ATCC 30864]